MKIFDIKRAVGGGGNRIESLKHFGGVCLKMCGLLRNILISPQRTLPNKTINNCFERGKKKFLGELNELRNFREEHNLKLSCRNSNSDLPKQLRCIPLNKFLILGRKFNLFLKLSFHI